ncbi:NAD(P)H-dependent oxidoreductase [archaeon AH-315-M20]|nr:NAD(P)H-dependent oxidoreductase [archaeon AH-315-M20]
MPLNIAVIYGSARSNRQGIKAAKFIVKKLEERDYEVTLVDSQEYKLPFLDKMYKEYKDEKAPELLEKLAQIIKKADGYMVVSAEYNHSVPAALKNLIDYFMEEYFYKPSGIVTYSAGPFGGVRVAVHLRAILGEVGTVSIPSMFPISKVQDSFDEDGNALDEAYNKRIKKFLDEFDWYLKALKAARDKEKCKAEEITIQQEMCRK